MNLSSSSSSPPFLAPASPPFLAPTSLLLLLPACCFLLPLSFTPFFLSFTQSAPPKKRKHKNLPQASSYAASREPSAARPSLARHTLSPHFSSRGPTIASALT
uniref:Uncharacterized protein n=1 Tax=Opuntia streptacantha TaxID=393608 RepID=A0A7C9E2Z3_OPUST